MPAVKKKVVAAKKPVKTMYDDILSATKVKAEKKDTVPTYVERACTALAGLDDAAFAKLDSETVDWFNAQVELINKETEEATAELELPLGHPDAEEAGEEESEEQQEEEDVAPKKKVVAKKGAVVKPAAKPAATKPAATKPAVKPATKPAAKEKAAKEKKPRATSASEYVRELVVRSHRKGKVISPADVTTKMASKGLECKESHMLMMYNSTLATLKTQDRIIAEEG